MVTAVIKMYKKESNEYRFSNIRNYSYIFFLLLSLLKFLEFNFYSGTKYD